MDVDEPFRFSVLRSVTDVDADRQFKGGGNGIFGNEGVYIAPIKENLQITIPLTFTFTLSH